MSPNDGSGVNLTDSAQVGHNAIGPTTGDIIINSGTNNQICSMCKTPIDAVNNPGLFCFAKGCETLFCSNCESFFRESREPGEPPYCAEHIHLVTDEETDLPPPSVEPVSGAVIGATNTIPAPMIAPPQAQLMGNVHQPVPMQMGGQVFANAQHPPTYGVIQGNPYLNQRMIPPLEAFRRTIGNWSGEGRAQRSEYWFGGTIYAFTLFVTLFIVTVPISNRFDESMYLAFGCFVLTAYIPLISLTIRRLHDVGYSGWMILIVFIPWIGGFILFILTIIPSEDRPNRYG